jgi:hypothetical protein
LNPPRSKLSISVITLNVNAPNTPLKGGGYVRFEKTQLARQAQRFTPAILHSWKADIRRTVV